MAEEQIQLPGSSYDRIVEIIKAYGHFEHPVGPGDVAGLLNFDSSEVSRNNGFLVSIGVLERGRAKILSERGRLLARALDHEISEEVTRRWQDILVPNEFVQRVLAALRIRGGMDPGSLFAHIAYSAGVTRSGRTLTSARAVAEILRAGDLIYEEDGRILARRRGAAAADQVIEEPDQPALRVAEPLGSGGTRRSERSPSITIQIQVVCAPADLDDLADQLEQLLKRLDNATPP